MLRPITLDEMEALDTPRDCVIAYQTGPNRTLMVSYDPRGAVFEEFTTTPSRATPAVSDRLLERVREHEATRLRLI